MCIYRKTGDYDKGKARETGKECEQKSEGVRDSKGYGRVFKRPHLVAVPKTTPHPTCSRYQHHRWLQVSPLSYHALLLSPKTKQIKRLKTKRPSDGDPSRRRLEGQTERETQAGGGNHDFAVDSVCQLPTDIFSVCPRAPPRFTVATPPGGAPCGWRFAVTLGWSRRRRGFA